VFDTNGSGERAFALLPSKEAAERWIAWMTTEIAEDDRLGYELCVCEVHDLSARVWNSYEPAPAAPVKRVARCERCAAIVEDRRAKDPGPRVVAVWVLGHAYEPDDGTVVLCESEPCPRFPFPSEGAQ
jgi:hypothetical protein